jgi:hypothetical protein
MLKNILDQVLAAASRSFVKSNVKLLTRMLPGVKSMDEITSMDRSDGFCASHRIRISNYLGYIIHRGGFRRFVFRIQHALYRPRLIIDQYQVDLKIQPLVCTHINTFLDFYAPASGK